MADALSVKPSPQPDMNSLIACDTQYCLVTQTNVPADGVAGEKSQGGGGKLVSSFSQPSH